MKEYLFKYNDQYTLVELSKEDAESNPEQYIEVPEGAEIYGNHTGQRFRTSIRLQMIKTGITAA